MTRRPIFWVVLAGLSLLSAGVGLRYFTVALPVVSLDISMDRSRAESEARRLASQYGWGPAEARHAISFGQSDSIVQPFIELERGGREAVIDLADQGLYHSYLWTVRRFAEGEAEETRVWFTPSGDPWGFELTLAEDDPGTRNLSGDEARALSEAGAREWNVDLGDYDFLESSVETLPSGRVDHTLIYQRSTAVPGGAELRLRMAVAGDRASELRRFVQVPEAFAREYADMRSANASISLAANAVFMLFFILLGAVGGTAYLLRKRWVVWRAPLLWGAVIAFLFGLNVVNALPLAWMGYDTAVSSGVFLAQSLFGAVAIALLGAPILALFFMAAESLGRRAFPDHLQQWRLWSRDVAASTPALGRTAFAYVLLGFEIGYVVFFYMGTSRLSGWWSPASPLVQPDLLAMYLPWLGAVSTSMFAALWEESIFRAVPIACAALIGARFGKRNAWIWGAIVLQALVFAASHANYPQQPAYARVVELTLPAFVWGVVYLYFGLVPTILTHFFYNLSLFSMVLFAADAPAIWLDRGVILVVGVVPLAIVLWARSGGRARSEAPAWAYNGAWTPPDNAETTGQSQGDVALEPTGRPESAEGAGSGDAAPFPARPTLTRFVYGLGLLGAVVWLFSMVTADEVPRLAVSRTAAVQAARSALIAQGAPIEGWSALARTRSGRGSASNPGGSRGDPHRYVFAEAGPEAWSALQSGYLASPHWTVRFVNFAAEPEERVEEYQAFVDEAGNVVRISHTVPEAREGASLERDEARTLAVTEVTQRFALGQPAASEVGAEETSRPARRDWIFTFRDPEILEGLEGEGRVAVEIAGDEVMDAYRFVHVPETWARESRKASTRRSLIGGVSAFLAFLAYAAAIVAAIVLWGRKKLTRRVIVPAAGLAFLAIVLSSVNGWPSMVAGFSTAQTFGVQVGGAMLVLVLVSIVGALALGLAIGLAHHWVDDAIRSRAPRFTAVACGMILVGVGASVAALSGGLPGLPDYAPASAYVSFLDQPLGAVVSFLFTTSALLLLVGARRSLGGRTATRGLFVVLVLLIGVVVVPSAMQEAPISWIVGALGGAGILWALVRLVDLSAALAPGIMATAAVVGMIEVAVRGPYPGAGMGAVLGIAVLVVMARKWTEVLEKPAVDAETV